MLARKQMARGFTLVEILIVVVILGILAAIVIPQFSSASESAKSSSLVSQIQTIRSQLELAQVQHNGTYPDLVNDGWDVMTSETEPDSAYTTATDGSGNEVGPYLQQAPSNPFAADPNASTAVAADDSAAWNYDNTTGMIRAVVDLTNAQATNLGLSVGAVGNTTGDVILAP